VVRFQLLPPPPWCLQHHETPVRCPSRLWSLGGRVTGTDTCHVAFCSRHCTVFKARRARARCTFFSNPTPACPPCQKPRWGQQPLRHHTLDARQSTPGNQRQRGANASNSPATRQRIPCTRKPAPGNQRQHLAYASNSPGSVTKRQPVSASIIPMPTTACTRASTTGRPPPLCQQHPSPMTETHLGHHPPWWHLPHASNSHLSCQKLTWAATPALAPPARQQLSPPRPATHLGQ